MADSRFTTLVEGQRFGLRYPSGLRALQDVDIQIGAGEFVSIVGPSGCGKSTLLKVLAGLLPATEGAVTVAGRTPLEARRQDHRVAVVFQEPTLLSWRTVRGNVRLPLELNRTPATGTGDRLADVLGWVGLAEFANTYPPQLSGGMQMRVSLARALVARPDLLLLDEPFGALDELTRQRLNADLVELWLRDRWTALFVTHNVFEGVFLSNRVLVMSSRPGRLVAEVPIPLPYPRSAEMRTSTELNHLAQEVSARLRDAG